MQNITFYRLFKRHWKNYRLQECSLKQEVKFNEMFENNWEVRNEWLPYLKNDVLTTAVSYARYTLAMEKLTGFGVIKPTILLSLANMSNNSLRDENDEPVYL